MMKTAMLHTILLMICALHTAYAGLHWNPPFIHTSHIENTNDFPYHHQVFGSCPLSAFANSLAFTQWCDQRMKEIEGELQTPLEALHHMIKNQSHHIAKQLPQYEFLLKAESYQQPCDIPQLAPVNDWFSLIKAFFIVDHCNALQSGRTTNALKISHEKIKEGLDAKNLNSIFDKTPEIYTILLFLRAIHDDPLLQLKAFPAHQSQFPIIDYNLALVKGTLIVPVAYDYTGSEEWGSHNGGFLNLLSGFLEHDLHSHVIPTFIEGEMCNSGFLKKDPGKSVLQTLATKLLHYLQENIQPVRSQTEYSDFTR